jgi:hypothetical protein
MLTVSIEGARHKRRVSLLLMKVREGDRILCLPHRISVINHDFK